MGGVPIAGVSLTMLAVSVGRGSVHATLSALRDQIARSPGFYRNAPVLLNVAAAPQLSSSLDFERLKEEVRALGLIPVGIQGGTGGQRESAIQADLPSFPVGATASYGRAGEEVRKGIEQTPPASPGPAMVPRPVRSGDRIYARDRDLVVIGAVGSGAEVMADGNVHVYGPLRGRAMAGVSGNDEARIFCSSLEGELVAISGRYLVRENIPAEYHGTMVSVSLTDGHLSFSRL